MLTITKTYIAGAISNNPNNISIVSETKIVIDGHCVTLAQMEDGAAIIPQGPAVPVSGEHDVRNNLPCIITRAGNDYTVEFFFHSEDETLPANTTETASTYPIYLAGEEAEQVIATEESA